MASVATPELLSHLKSLYPVQSDVLKNPWYIAAAVAFSASNLPEAVPLVFQYALNDLDSHPSANHAQDSLLLVRNIKDALFKSGLLSGYPKVRTLIPSSVSISQSSPQAINAMAALYAVLPDHLKDTKPLRCLTSISATYES
jgi:hypothetical protein